MPGTLATMPVSWVAVAPLERVLRAAGYLNPMAPYAALAAARLGLQVPDQPRLGG